MRRVGESFVDSESPGAARKFAEQVRLVEGTLRQTYREAAALVQRTEDIGEIADIWSGMSSFCSFALQALATLKDKYSECGTTQLYDLALDYKLASDKRHRGVMEEIACQNQEFPKGLFPESI